MTFDHWKTTNPDDAQYCVCGRYGGDCLMVTIADRAGDRCTDRCPQWDPAPEPADEAPDR